MNLPLHHAKLEVLRQHIEKIFVGKSEVVQQALICFFAGGHLLIEDVPGVGKTTLAVSLAKAVDCTFQRVQFTSDLLPSDILGISMLRPQTQEFEFKRGPIFHQIILADELNRATPRTQSALLEAMNERQVTMDTQTHALPQPFFVIGTQNPHEYHGTFPLPESQLDRFMMRISIGYPDASSERQILSDQALMETTRNNPPCLSLPELLSVMKAVPEVKVASVIDEYILTIAQATRKSKLVEVGVSPRGSLALRRAAQASALLMKRDFVTPDDVKSLAVPTLAHRLIFSSAEVAGSRVHSERIVRTILQDVTVPV